MEAVHPWPDAELPSAVHATTGNATATSPVTVVVVELEAGSAAGPAGSFIARYGLVPANRVGAIVFQQGVLAGRPSRLHVKITTSGENITKVQVGGGSVVVGQGELAS